MNFFTSMLSDDPEPQNMDNSRKTTADCPPNHQQTETAAAEFTNSNSTSSGEIFGAGGLWSFGDLVKTLATKSESVLETYRRDLKEFGSGLRKESDLFREVANRAVKDLPSSIEVGASAIDGVLKSTADIISQGKDVLLEPSEVDESGNSDSVQSSRVYNRFDSQLNAIRADARTYCDDPDDLDDFSNWKLGFVLSDRESEMERLIEDNGTVESIYKKVVPNQVDDAIFWCRYFYRVHKLKQQEDIRAQFVRRSLTVDDDEEELSWDTWDAVDIDDDNMNNAPTIDQNHVQRDAADDNMNNGDAAIVNTNNVATIDQNHEQCDVAGDVAMVNMNNVPIDDQSYEQSDVAGDNMNINSDVDIVSMKNVPEIDQNDDDSEKVESVPKTDEHYKNSGKDLQEDEDLEWDEIGDTGDDDEKHVVRGETVKKGEFLKRVNIAEDDEDLSWDIEDDDDEPEKTSSRK